MDSTMIIFIAIIMLVSLSSAALLVIFFLRTKKKAQEQENAGLPQEVVRRNYSRKIRLLSWIFLIFFGLVFGCSGAAGIMHLQNKTEGWEQVPAKISYVEKSYIDNVGDNRSVQITAEVDYEYRGEFYEAVQLGYTSTSMKEGQQITIMVNPEEPGQIEYFLPSQIRFLSIFVISGSIITLLGLFLLVFELRKKQDK